MKFRVLDQTHPPLSLIPAPAAFYDSSVTHYSMAPGHIFPPQGLCPCSSWPQCCTLSLSLLAPCRHTLLTNSYPSIPSQFGGSSLTLLSVWGTAPLLAPCNFPSQQLAQLSLFSYFNNHLANFCFSH